MERRAHTRRCALAKTLPANQDASSSEDFRIKISTEINGYMEHVLEILFIPAQIFPTFQAIEHDFLVVNNKLFIVRLPILEFFRQTDSSQCPTQDYSKLSKTKQRMYRAMVLLECYELMNRLDTKKYYYRGKSVALHHKPCELESTLDSYELEIGFNGVKWKIAKINVLLFHHGLEDMMRFLIAEMNAVCTDATYEPLSGSAWFFWKKILDESPNMGERGIPTYVTTDDEDVAYSFLSTSTQIGTYGGRKLRLRIVFKDTDIEVFDWTSLSTPFAVNTFPP
jgi:hypothetical protein